jgi:hypothetical protein
MLKNTEFAQKVAVSRYNLAWDNTDTVERKPLQAAV